MNEHPLSLDTFERLVYLRNYDRAVSMLLEIIQGIESKTFDLTPADLPDATGAEIGETKLILITRFVAAITTMFSDPAFDMKEPIFLKLLLHKRSLVSLFAITSFSNMDHIITLAGEATGNGQVAFRSKSSLFKLLLASSIYTDPTLVLNTLKAAPKELKLVYWISLVDTETVLDAQADQLRNQLLSEGEPLQNQLVPADFAIRLTNIWMWVSYFTTPEKHEAKKYINQMLLKLMKEAGVTQPSLPSRKTDKRKPKLLVLSERLHAGHAMYRCHSHSLAQLRSKFHTTLVAGKGTYDELSSSLFDELIDFDIGEPIQKIFDKIIKAQGDIIYYPSVGMEAWCIMACQFRLAPIQMMTLGHPATSNCEFMDYALIEEFSFGEPQCFTETVVIKNEGSKFSPCDDEEIPAPVVREKPNIIKIAIPAVIHKLNSDFIRVCKNIQNHCKRPLQFHFFPNRTGILLDFATQMIRKQLPNAIVYPTMTYQDYMKQLGACDMHFSTFPFGLVNGIVDSSLCALPIVALDGPEVHSHSDVGLQKRLGLPDWLSAKSQEEFEEAAIRLIDDDALRVQISKELVSADPAKIFFANHQTDTDYFANLVYWIYRNHEALQSDGRKIWTEEDFAYGDEVRSASTNRAG